MLIKNYHKPKSSFLSIEKDLSTFIDMMLGDQKLMKLLYYTQRGALEQDDLTEEQALGLINNQIKIVPKLEVDGMMENSLIISFDNFKPSSNPEFRDNIITFDIICHYNQWQLEDFQLRPYRIAAEIDTMFDNKHFSGIGTMQFARADQLLINDDYAGVSIVYTAIHGEDDKVGTPNPEDEEAFITEFYKKPYRN